MSCWWSFVCLITVFGIVAALYGLHRLCLWLEDAGYMYYVREKPGASSGGRGLGPFVELQKALEPTTQYVVEAKEERVLNVRDDEGDRDLPRFFPKSSGDDSSPPGAR